MTQIIKHKKLLFALLAVFLCAGMVILLCFLMRPEVVHSVHEPEAKFGKTSLLKNRPITWQYDRSSGDQAYHEFQFSFDIRYSMEAYCSKGTLVMRERGNDHPVVAWNPLKNEELLDGTTIRFTLKNGDEIIGKGKIKIERTYLSEHNRFAEYQATMTNFDLFLGGSSLFNYGSIAQPTASKVLVEAHPDYFVYDTFEGVEVYVRKTYREELICYVRANNEDIRNFSGIHGLPSMSMKEAKTLLSAYDKQDVFVYLIGEPPYSSFLLPVDDTPDYELVKTYREMLGVS